MLSAIQPHTHEVTLTPAQFDMLTETAPLAAFIAGIGTGKSFVLAHDVMSTAIHYPHSQILVAANSYGQLQAATVPAIMAVLDEAGVTYSATLSGAKKFIQIGPCKVLLYSLDNFEMIRGIQVGSIFIDEAAYATQEAIDVCLGRLRDKKGPLKFRIYSSPRGFNFLYDFINKNNVATHKGRTSDNKTLPPSYYTQLLDLYGGPESPLAQQELFGEFVNLTANSVYYTFRREQHLNKTQEDLTKPVYVMLDFNVGKMNAVVAQYDLNNGFTVLREIVLRDAQANTFSMASEIYSLYGNRAIVIPDSTANARKTSAEAGVTDLTILKNSGLTVRHTQNPRIKDRQNSVNIMFHKNRIKIDPSCTNLIKELETLSSDKEEGLHSHLAVCLGYGVWFLEPLKTPQRPSMTLSSPFVNRT